MIASERLSFLAEEARKADRDRFVLTLLAPADKREALFALYALDRELARLKYAVAEPGLQRIRLKWWQETLESIFARRPVDHPVAEALAVAVARQDLPASPFLRLVEARRVELDGDAPADLAEFERRSEGLGAPMLELALAILGGEGVAAARHVGIAWATTAILRNLAADVAIARPTLPLSLLAEHGFDGEILSPGAAATPGVVAALADLARSHIALAREGETSRDAIPALLAATVAEGYLNRLEQQAGYDAFRLDWRETRPRPALLMWKAFRRRF